MIFVTVGTQKEQFSRIIKYIVNSQILKQKEIIIQAGYTKYNDSYDESKIKILEFISKEKFNEYIINSEFIICHGGVGSIFSGLLNKKKVLAIPRLKKYNEHVDDHQIEITDKLQSLGYILSYNELVDGEDKFDEKVDKLENTDFKEYISDNSFLKKLGDQI